MKDCNIAMAAEGELKKDMEDMIMDTQDQALRAIYL